MKYALILLAVLSMAACGGVTTSQSSPQTVTTSTQHYVSLNWIASTTPNVTYNVYRGTQTLGPYTQIAQHVSDLTYDDHTAQIGVLYFYVVTAVDTSNGESPYSNEATAIIPN